MILIDTSQLIYATIHESKEYKQTYDMGIFRHIVLNSLRANVMKFKREYGQVVLCFDGNNSWRREYFPYYKAARRLKRAQEKDDPKALDWNTVMGHFNQIVDELKENFPYKTIHEDGCEGDDCIAVLTKRFQAEQKILILSSDNDFRQLQVYPNVSQWSTSQKKWVRESNPKKYLHEHIISGDRGDGVPNIKSPDDVFIDDSKRQSRITQKFLKEIHDCGKIPSEFRARYDRNKNLIDLIECIPEKIQQRINDAYDSCEVPERLRIRPYFMQNKLRLLFEHIGDF